MLFLANGGAVKFAVSEFSGVDFMMLQHGSQRWKLEVTRHILS